MAPVISRRIFFSFIPQISNFVKIRPVLSEIFHADWQDEVNSRFFF
jgi:hypothetical protein